MKWQGAYKTGFSRNTSGLGINSVVPGNLKGWNWGAFLLGPIWGIAHRSWAALLCFIPCVSIAMPFIFGAYGNEWAWRNRKWNSFAHFIKVQKKWATAGIIMWAIFLPLMFLLSIGLIISINLLLKNSIPFRIAMEKVQQSEEVKLTLGVPIKSGMFVTGSIIQGSLDGSANLQFSFKGPAGSGKAYCRAIREIGEWHLINLVVEKPDKTRITLIEANAKERITKKE